MENLISMREFVLKTFEDTLTVAFQFKVFNYASFLSQPLKLGMFVPCDEDNEPWTHPPTVEELEWAEKDSADAEMSYRRKVKDYIIAQNKVLFEGCYIFKYPFLIGSISHEIRFLDPEKKVKALFYKTKGVWELNGCTIIEDITDCGLKLKESAKNQLFQN